VKPTTHVQQRQKLRYGSKEWFDTYRADRNSSESSNDLLQKDHNLENAMARPMHGLAAQQFALALFAVASSSSNTTSTNWNVEPPLAAHPSRESSPTSTSKVLATVTVKPVTCGTRRLGSSCPGNH
jgi:hypothetical protein